MVDPLAFCTEHSETNLLSGISWQALCRKSKRGWNICKEFYTIKEPCTHVYLIIQWIKNCTETMLTGIVLVIFGATCAPAMVKTNTLQFSLHIVYGSAAVTVAITMLLLTATACGSCWLLAAFFCYCLLLLTAVVWWCSCLQLLLFSVTLLLLRLVVACLLSTACLLLLLLLLLCFCLSIAVDTIVTLHAHT